MSGPKGYGYSPELVSWGWRAIDPARPSTQNSKSQGGTTHACSHLSPATLAVPAPLLAIRMSWFEDGCTGESCFRKCRWEIHMGKSPRFT